MERVCNVSILGSGWDLFVCDFNEDPWFEKNDADGKCTPAIRWIKLVNQRTDKRIEYESEEEMLSYMRNTLKHELVHAFLSEAGLDHNSNHFEGAWAVNEEMVEFFAVQLEKIHRAVDEAWGFLREKLAEPREEGRSVYGDIALCSCSPKKGVYDGSSQT